MPGIAQPVATTTLFVPATCGAHGNAGPGPAWRHHDAGQDEDHAYEPDEVGPELVGRAVRGEAGVCGRTQVRHDVAQPAENHHEQSDADDPRGRRDLTHDGL